VRSSRIQLPALSTVLTCGSKVETRRFCVAFMHGRVYSEQILRLAAMPPTTGGVMIQYVSRTLAYTHVVFQACWDEDVGLALSSNQGRGSPARCHDSPR